MHKQRLAILIASVIGILSVFMPWANIPVRGSINAMESFGQAGSMGIYVLLIFAVPLVFALLGDRTKPIWMWSGKALKKGIKIIIVLASSSFLFTPLPLLFFRANPFAYLASLVNLIMIYVVSQFIEQSTHLGNTKLAVKYSMGFGFGVAIVVAVCLLLLSFEGVAKKLFGNDGFDR